MYTDEHLQDHELAFWIDHFNPPLYHEEWYKTFFNFKELEDKKVVDVGCGGYPISQYAGVSMDLTLVDPLIDKLVANDKYRHLADYKKFAKSILEFRSTKKFDYLTCLNVVDHFNDPALAFIDVFKNSLKPNGILWLYYDVRNNNSAGHLAIDHDRIMERINQDFEIIKLDDSINPRHLGWAEVNKSIRVVAKKKSKTL